MKKHLNPIKFLKRTLAISIFTIVHLDAKKALTINCFFLPFSFPFGIIITLFPSLSCSYFTVAQKAVNVHMITARMDTMSAVALSTDSVTTTLIITVIVLCLLLLAQGAVPSGGALRHQTHILTLEFETPSLLLMLHDVTSTEMTEDDVLIELTITAEADHLIPPSQDTLPHNGPRDRPPKLPIPLKELLCPLGEAHVLNPAADLQALILSAAPAVQAVAGETLFLLY